MIAVAVLSVTLAYAVADQDAQVLAQFIWQVKNKTITQPAQLTRDAVALDIAKTELMINELQSIVDRLSAKTTLFGASPIESFKTIINDIKTIQFDLARLVIPNEGFAKSFENIEQWMLLKAKKMQLAARELNEVAQQTGIAQARVLAAHKEQKARQIEDALRLVQSGTVGNSTDDLIETIKTKALDFYKELEKKANTKFNEKVNVYKRKAGEQVGNTIGDTLDDYVDLAVKKAKEIYERYQNQIQPKE